MGQQQLLLLVLATVIVGIATVVGIQAFSQNSAKSNADALMNDAVRIASDVQAWAQKAEPFGGPSTFGAVDEATFGLIGYTSSTLDDGNDTTTDPNGFTNLNGSYTLASGLITGFKDTDGDGTNDQEVQVRVCGLTDADINGAVMKVGGQDTGATAPATC